MSAGEFGVWFGRSGRAGVLPCGLFGLVVDEIPGQRYLKAGLQHLVAGDGDTYGLMMMMMMMMTTTTTTTMTMMMMIMMTMKMMMMKMIMTAILTAWTVRRWCGASCSIPEAEAPGAPQTAGKAQTTW